MFLYSQWMQLPISTRHKIAAEFKIIKKGPTEVFSNEIKSDGYHIKDIEGVLTKEALQAYIKTDENDLGMLFEWMVDKIEERVVRTPEIVLPTVSEDIVQPPAKKRGRPKKNV